MDTISSIFKSLWGSKAISYQSVEDLFDEPTETKDFEGVVTSLAGEDGVVDFKIYFTLKENWPLLEIGNRVSGTIGRRRPNEAWRVIDLELSPERSDPNGETSLPEITRLSRVIVERITKISDTEVTIVSGFRFNIARQKFPFAFEEGDWVEIERAGDKNIAVRRSQLLPLVNIKANRIKSVHGIITACSRKRLVINDDIFCDSDLAEPGCRTGDSVIARVIESDIENFSWRAVECVSDVYKNESAEKYAVDNNVDEAIEGSISEDRLKEILNVSELEFCDSNDVIIDVPQACLSWPGPKSQATVLINVTSTLRYSMKVENMWIISPQFIEWRLAPWSSKEILADDETKLPLICSSPCHGSFIMNVVIVANELLFSKKVSIYVEPAPVRLSYPRSSTYENGDDVVPGVRKFSNQKKKFAPRIPAYRISEDLQGAVRDDRVLRAYPVVEEILAPKNYVQKLSLLVYLEEMAVIRIMNQYRIDEAPFRKEDDFLTLFVPTLAERRPSLAPGDSVVAMSVGGGHKSAKYQGFVHCIQEFKVYLKFHEHFHDSYDGGSYQISFRPNRTQFRRQHYCLEKAMSNLGSRVIFPTKIPKRKRNKKLVKEESLKFVNTNMNKEQRAAICRILEGVARPAPYIIYGPPGTGKTVTLVECALQVYKMVPHSRMLLVTLSNSACDLLMSRLLQWGVIQDKDIIRILSYNRDRLLVPEDLQPFCVDGSDLESSVRRRVVLCTAAVSGQFHAASIKNGLFSHIFFDEAGQLSEPEICVSLSLADPNSCQVVLAGDPKQLGPMVNGEIPKKYGLHVSMLQRLTSSVLYQPSIEVDENGESAVTYDERLVTQLNQSYRSHPDIIAVPSKLFYHSTLKAALPPEEADSLLAWPELPNPKCPILFYGVRGETEQGESTSWFNILEAMRVSEYARKLVEFGVDVSDIGIITPYRKQVDKIRCALNIHNVNEIKVASVEEFQGQERKVIILSTVRSSKGRVQKNGTVSIGFLKSPERFNVAISRAQFLLVIIGDPVVLQTDYNWRRLLKFCISRNAYTGLQLQQASERVSEAS